jgi:pteridine reductase
MANSTRKAALITGAAKRIGAALAREFAADHDLLLHYGTSAAEARALADELAPLTRCEIMQADLRDPAAPAALAAAMEKSFGRCDLLIHSASIFANVPLGEITAAQIDENFAVHARAPLLLTQALMRALRDCGGNVIAIVDVGAANPWPGYLPYCSSKAALESLVKGLAKSLAPAVRVNGIAPGPIEPPPWYSPADIQRGASLTLLKKWGGAGAVVKAARFLAGHDYITGEILRVDGGRHLH